MTDTNRPAAWRVIDNKEPRAIVGQYATLHEATAVCHEMERSVGSLRFTTEPVRAAEHTLAAVEDVGK